MKMMSQYAGLQPKKESGFSFTISFGQFLTARPVQGVAEITVRVLNRRSLQN